MSKYCQVTGRGPSREASPTPAAVGAPSPRFQPGKPEGEGESSGDGALVQGGNLAT